MVALDHIDGVNDLAYLRRVFKEGGEFRPIVPPRVDNERVLPRLLKTRPRLPWPMALTQPCYGSVPS